ncbi:MAG: N-acetylglucosamine-6-phosphate deacetylase, partial [Planctomycetota bacterium]
MSAGAEPSPGFFDLQVNGYAGVDFNRDGLTGEALHTACEALKHDGVAGFFPTIITDDLEAMHRRLTRLAELREKDELAKRLIAGLHVEGPFLNETSGYIGAHPAEHARPATVEAADRLLDAGRGLVRLVTLAPERDSGGTVTRALVERGVTVAAGHCDPSRDELAAACDAGLSLFTHLGNGCPALLPRHDNVISRALSLRDRLRFTLIADGVHLPFWFLRDLIDRIGLNRCAVVSDAVTAAGLGPGRFTLGRWELEVGEDLA